MPLNFYREVKGCRLCPTMCLPSLRSGHHTARRCTGPKWSNMVKINILVTIDTEIEAKRNDMIPELP